MNSHSGCTMVKNSNLPHGMNLSTSLDRTMLKRALLITGAAETKNIGSNYYKPYPVNPGTWVHKSTGEIWPRPQKQTKSVKFYTISRSEYQFKVNGRAEKCDLIVSSLGRFMNRLFPHETKAIHIKNDNYLGSLNSTSVVLSGPCESWPHPAMEESYKIVIRNGNSFIFSSSPWGILRGLESFTHLTYSSKEHGFQIQLNETVVNDRPTFSYRGVMLDSSRHFLNKEVILEQLNLMEMNKINVFHWHLSDDNSFPFVSKTFPDLSFYGAYDPVTHVYKPEDIADILEAARIRGIRIIPEFDTPGHVKAWEPGQPGLLSECENVFGKPTGVFGPLDVSKSSTFDFLSEFFNEVFETFPDAFIHLGGDEIELDNCWNRNKRMRSFVNQLVAMGVYSGIQNYYMDQLLKLLQIKQPKKDFIVWEDVLEKGFNETSDLIIQVWKDWGGVTWQERMEKVTAKGHRAILSSNLHLDVISYGSDWMNLYETNPLNFEGTSDQKSLVLGGEMLMWGEFVSSSNSVSRLWPRGSAPAEIFWNGKRDEWHLVGPRIQEHECRMKLRGFEVGVAVGAGFCSNPYL